MKFSILILDLVNRLEQSNLLLLNVAVFKLSLIKFSDESVDFLSIFADTIEVFLLHMLHFDLNLLILIEEISVLILKLISVALTVFHLLNFTL